MRLALFSVFLIVSGCDEASPLTPEPPPVALDGGEVADAGTTADDAGPISDAGEIEDAGAVSVDDAGPPYVQTFPDAGPCAPPSGIQTFHVCEGDEDLCEPVPDIGLPDFDILGVWSRVEGNEFVIDALFLRQPFTFPGHIDLAFVIDDDSGNDDCGHVDNDFSAVAPADLLVFATNQEDPNGAYYPPIQFYVLESCYGAPLQPLDASTHLRLSTDGHAAELRLPLELVQRSDGTPPVYGININHGGDVGCGDEFPHVSADNFLRSRGGEPDGDHPFPEAPPATCILGEPLGAPCLGD